MSGDQQSKNSHSEYRGTSTDDEKRPIIEGYALRHDTDVQRWVECYLMFHEQKLEVHASRPKTATQRDRMVTLKYAIDATVAEVIPAEHSREKFKLFYLNHFYEFQVEAARRDAWITAILSLSSLSSAAAITSKNSSCASSSNQNTILEEKSELPSEKNHRSASHMPLELLHANLIREAEMAVCAECRMPHPHWCSVLFGIFVCEKCAQIHQFVRLTRSLVKCTNDTNWTHAELQCVLTTKNGRANSFWEAQPPRNRPALANLSAIRDWIISKYLQCEFISIGTSEEDIERAIPLKFHPPWTIFRSIALSNLQSLPLSSERIAPTIIKKQSESFSNNNKQRRRASTSLTESSSSSYSDALHAYATNPDSLKSAILLLSANTEFLSTLLPLLR